MTITIDLAPEDEERLKESAQRLGQDVAAFAAGLLENALAETTKTTAQYARRRLEQTMTQMTRRSPDEIIAARERVLAASRTARRLPENKTLEDVVIAQWPGNETDQEVQAALDDLS